jgi:hypothetical protein
MSRLEIRVGQSMNISKERRVLECVIEHAKLSEDLDNVVLVM